MRKRNQALLILAATVASAACQDLNVVDENNPDTERALGEPGSVETVIKSSFQIWFDYLHNYQDIYYWFPMIADEMTSTVMIRGVLPGGEPREALKNDPLSETVWIPRGSWDGFASTTANANDALRAMDCDDSPTGGCRMTIETVDDGATEPTDNTVRARAYGKIFQGVGLGYLGLSQDQGALATEDDVLPKGYDDLIRWEKEHLTPYPQLLAAAIASIEEGIAIIEASPPFTLGPSWITGQTYTSAQLAQFANSMIARLLVYGARTPAERQAVNWQKVLAVTAKGLTFDFGPILATGLITSTFHSRIQRTSDTQQRADYRLIGPADISGNYQTWLNTPNEQRVRFNVTTPDRRITGATPTSSGSYFRYRSDNNGFDASRGPGYFSAYQWYRKAGSSNTGQLTLFSADENRLLRAEAFFRTGNNSEAASLINVSRTRTQRIGSTNYNGLPPVTANGVPQANDCVPRTKTGVCGSLWDALIYERSIESAGADALRAWYDNRGSGLLQPGTTYHMPIPGRYLISLGIPIYSYGGVGGQGAAQ